MLSAIAINSTAGTISISTGAGTASATGEQSPFGGGSPFMSLQGPQSSSEKDRPAEDERFLRISGDISMDELRTLRTPIVSFHAKPKGDVPRQGISERANRTLRRAVVGRQNEVDSMWVDAQTSLIVRESSTNRLSGDSFHCSLRIRVAGNWFDC